MILILLQVLGILGRCVLAQKSSPIANWHMADPHYTSDQYAKILGEAGLGQDADDKEHKGLGPMQIQYVDYQPNCQPGGVPVCATNGTDSFYFENHCRLEAANMKMLFQHGTGECTDFRLLINCIVYIYKFLILLMSILYEYPKHLPLP